jgi:hypothetical protein
MAWQIAASGAFNRLLCRHPRAERLTRLGGKLPIKLLVCPNPEPKPIVAATKKPQPDDPALFELPKRVNPILIVPNAERDAQDFDGIFVGLARCCLDLLC